MLQPWSHPLRFLGACCAVALLTACGGGDDALPPAEEPVEEAAQAPGPAADAAEPAPVVDVVSKYVGAWVSECYTESGYSALVRANFGKASNTRITGNVVINAYLGTSCTGAVIQSERLLTNLSLSYDGTKAIGAAKAEKFAGKADQGTGKVLLYLRGNTLQFGDPDAARDAQGYPNAFYDQSLQRL